jgi:hypothetical protein
MAIKAGYQGRDQEKDANDDEKEEGSCFQKLIMMMRMGGIIVLVVNY